MKKSMLTGMALLIGIFIFVSVSQAEVRSLRGGMTLEEESKIPSPKRWQPDRDPIARDYVQQPPLIPHTIKGYKVNLKFNKCLTCHSWANYKEKGATKISQTHFADREFNVNANVAARRYFCLQCHVPQVDAPPLVDNTFDAVPAVKLRR